MYSDKWKHVVVRWSCPGEDDTTTRRALLKSRHVLVHFCHKRLFGVGKDKGSCDGVNRVARDASTGPYANNIAEANFGLS